MILRCIFIVLFLVPFGSVSMGGVGDVYWCKTIIGGGIFNINMTRFDPEVREVFKDETYRTSFRWLKDEIHVIKSHDATGNEFIFNGNLPKCDDVLHCRKYKIIESEKRNWVMRVGGKIKTSEGHNYFKAINKITNNTIFFIDGVLKPRSQGLFVFYNIDFSDSIIQYSECETGVMADKF